MAPKDQRSPARAKAAAAELPRGRRIDVRRLLPSGPSLLVGFTLLALGVASYGVARETGLFAIQQIEVVGAPPDVSARVGAALEPLEGTSLVGLRASGPRPEDRRPAGRDRASRTTGRSRTRFASTSLPERALLVLRRGEESWLVSARARVVRPLERGALPLLPRIWVPRDVDVAAGDTLADGAARRAVRVLVLARARAPGARPDGPARRSRDDARPALRDRGAPGSRARPPAEARGRRARCSARPRGVRVPRRRRAGPTRRRLGRDSTSSRGRPH